MPPSDISTYKELYVSTARQYIKMLEVNLPAVVGARPDREQMDAVLIPAHSLKSQGYVMGYLNTGKLAAILEKKLLILKNNPEVILNQSDIDIMLDVTKHLNDSISFIEKNPNEPELKTTVEEFEQKLGVQVAPIA